MIEIFGYIGCIFVIISMLMTSVVKLRVINIYNLRGAPTLIPLIVKQMEITMI